MWRVIMLIHLLLIFSCCLAQEADYVANAVRLSGSSSEESADPDEVDRILDYLDRPLRLNLDRASRIKESGLLSPYQYASLMAYMNESGAVLSYSELAAIDGFGNEFVNILSPFISLDATTGPGETKSAYVSNDVSFRNSFLLSEGRASWQSAAKYRIQSSSGFSAALSMEKGGGSLVPGLRSGYLSWDSPRKEMKLIIGDFNARFAQGLVLWNGMSMSGNHTVSSLYRSPSGISSSWSYSGSTALTGMAFSHSHAGWRYSLALVLPFDELISRRGDLSFMTALNLTRNFRRFRCSLTHYSQFSDLSFSVNEMKTSFDVTCCFSGTDLFAETAYDWISGKTAFLSAAIFRLGDDSKAAVHVRSYPYDFPTTYSGEIRSGNRSAGELSLTAALESSKGRYVSINGWEGFGSSVRKHQLSFSVDAACLTYNPMKDKGLQFRSLFLWTCMLSDSFRMKLRISERFRTEDESRLKSDLRADMEYLSKSFHATCRMNFLAHQGIALLSYIEGGYKRGKAAFYLRQGLFLIDDWDNRIYVYERDAPGNFSVPACYGRGVWTASTFSWKFTPWGKIFLRASYITYPFMDQQNKKPGKAELKIHLIFDL